MEHLVQGMERKWERHFRETRTTISQGLVLVGLTCIVALVFMWPQKYSSQVFNERLKFTLTLDVSDSFSFNNI
jgi:cobalamin biosynthesis protein CobD/CbiB